MASGQVVENGQALSPAGGQDGDDAFHESATFFAVCPPEGFRQRTAWRRDCSLALLVGSTPSV